MRAELIQRVTAIIPTLEGWCTPDKAIDLVNLVLDRRPGLIVETGIFGGRSLFAMAMAVRENGFGQVWGVDPWTVEAALEGEESQANRDWWAKNVELEKIYRDFVQNVLNFGLLPHINWIRSKGKIAARIFDDKSISIGHIDSNHSELVSCLEVQTWEPKMADKSILIMDDADWPSQAKAIQMIKDRGFHVLHDRKSYIIFER